MIKASEHNRFNVELAKKNPLSAIEARDKCRLGSNIGRYYVETDLPSSRLEFVANALTGVRELIVKGNLKLSNPKIIRRK